MQSKIILALAGLFAMPAIAAPASDLVSITERGDLSARASTLFKICRDYNFQDCWDAPATIGTCTNVPPEFNDVISSLKATQAGALCYIYPDHGCNGNRGGPVTTADNHSDMRVHGWDNIVSSFVCV